MFVALIALLLTATDPPSTWPADPTRPVFVTDRNWIRRPSAAQLAAAWPAAARQAGVRGKVVMDCMVAYDGGLQDCKVVVETPADLGFGAAALGLAGHYQLTPMVDGQSATGGRMMVPVRFQPAG